MEPLISIIIPNHNGLNHLDVCLSALRHQTFRDFEAIVVDNGSRDGSIQFVRENFSEVRVVALPENRGFAGGINAGIAAARGKFIAWLNNDTEVDPGWLESLHSAIHANAAYHMWASRVVIFDRPQLLDSAGDEFGRAAVPFKRGHRERAGHYLVSKEVFAPSGSAALFSRALIEDVGKLDEEFFLVHEDVDFGLRARLLGYRCLYVPDAVVKHKVNSSIGYLSRDYVFYGQRNLEYVFLKNLPFTLLLRSLPAHCVFNLFAFGNFMMKGRALAFARAKLAALISLRKILQKRAVIQSRRSVSNKTLWQQMDEKWFAAKWKSFKRRDDHPAGSRGAADEKAGAA